MINKGWVKLHRLSNDYQTHLTDFLDTCFLNHSVDNKVKCPCRLCYNQYWRSRPEIQEHLTIEGMDPRYMDLPWINHGEAISNPTLAELPNDIGVMDHDTNASDMHCLLGDLFPSTIPREAGDDSGTTPLNPAGCTPQAEQFYKFVEDADAPLYPGCDRIKKLEFIVSLYHIKCLHGWTDESVSDLLTLLKRSFPIGETLPPSFYHTRKLIGKLGLTYEKIDACRHDCMLFWKDHSNDVACSVCGADRYTSQDSGSGHNVAAKVLRYFPLAPRLQRLYMSRHTAEHMTWHASKRVKDGVMRHPADSPAWTELDNRNPHFAMEPRNVRIGLASDGFNPFGHMSSQHSTWPVVITVYNLPPWMCMKQPYLFLSLLIPGPKAPGNDIDIYLEPLVDELRLLWSEGVRTYDIASDQSFTMRVALLWTINDFPAYANLSGWSTKGKFACPQCAHDTESQYLRRGHKHCYLGHRRFLPINHRFRREKSAFNGNVERRTAPMPVSGSACLQQLSTLRFKFGKRRSKPLVRVRTSTGDFIEYTGPWKKQSVFFSLPYWEFNLLRHNLDVMHIEKNVCDNLVGTLLGLEGKNKDGMNARADLELLNWKPTLHPIRRGSKTYLPPAAFTLSNIEKVMICQVLKSVKIPDGYSSNLSRCINVQEKKIHGLKSHDCHVLLQHLFPLAIRRVLPKPITSVFLELCNFFKNICNKTSTSQAFLDLNPRIALTLCQMERIFPPAFFDVMVHLTVHLATEASIGGPVQYRWMYPIERYLHTLKSYVRNKSRPEGSIAEGYLAEECLSFCSMYLQGVDTRRNRLGRNSYDGENVPRPGYAIFQGQGNAKGAGTQFYLDSALREHGHRLVLFNCPEAQEFISQHREAVRAARNRQTTLLEADTLADNTLTRAFKDHVEQQVQLGVQVDPDLLALSYGPSNWATRFKSFVTNGFRFRIKEIDLNKKNQNSGVFVVADTNSYASRRDRNPRIGPVGYYGVLTDIIELQYEDRRTVVLFDCEWADTASGVKKDEFGFNMVSFERLLRSDDTLVISSHAMQVFYVDDPLEIGWKVAVNTQPRDLYDMSTVSAGDVCGAQALDRLGADENVLDRGRDIDGTTIDCPLTPLHH